MSEFEKKLRAMYEFYLVDGEATFEEWMVLHAESEHRKSVKMSGDLGRALSDIGTYDQIIKEMIAIGRAVVDEE